MVQAIVILVLLLAVWVLFLLWRTEKRRSEDYAQRWSNEVSQLEATITSLRESIEQHKSADRTEHYKKLFNRYRQRAEVAEGKLWDIAKIAIPNACPTEQGS